MHKNPHVELFIKGVGLAATGLVAATAFGVMNFNDAHVWQIAVFFGTLFVSLKWKINPLFVLIGGGIIGLIF